MKSHSAWPLIISQFNPDVMHGLRVGALAYLAEKEVTIAPDSIYSAPGACKPITLAS